MRIFTLVLLAISCYLGSPASPAFAKPPTEEILAEGLRLYQSERSSWVATDLLMTSLVDHDQIGGYLSYLQGDSVRTIFWAKGSAGVAGNSLLASYTFPRQDVRLETCNSQRRVVFSEYEAKLFAIRQAAVAQVNLPASKFGVPPNSSVNPALVNDSQEVRVYMLVGPHESNVIPLGNDFLFTYTLAGKLKASDRLHNSYLPMRPPEGKQQVITLFHTHLEAHPYITASDICSLLLYREAVPAQQCIVMSKEYVSIFSMEKQSLVILTKQAFEKIASYATPDKQ